MLKFDIVVRGAGRARVGLIHTSHENMKTPAYIAPATKASVKGINPEQVRALGGEAVIANTYHLYLEPGDKVVRDAGGLHKFMNWEGPIFTDSGGFQVFSLGEAYGIGLGELTKWNDEHISRDNDLYVKEKAKLMKIDNDGVNFRSHIDGSEHRFTPERSMEIQYNLGSDIALC